MAYVFVDRDLIEELHAAAKCTGKSITQLANEGLMRHFKMDWLEGKDFNSLFCSDDEPNIRTRKFMQFRRLIIEKDFFFKMYKIQSNTGEPMGSQATRAIRTHIEILMSLKKQDASEVGKK